MLQFLAVETTVAAANPADLAPIAQGIGEISTWFWGLFTDFVNMISTNNLLLWCVVFAIVAGSVGLAIKVVRKFGVKGRR